MVDESTPDDAALIRQVLDGATARFEVLVRRHERAVFGLVGHLSGPGDDPEEFAHEAFVSAFEHLARFDPRRGAFRTWLLTIARNKCRNARRRTRPQELEPEMTAPDEHDPLRRSGDREILERLDQALDTLPEDQRVAFVLAEFVGLSHAEIREIEDIEAGTVKSRIARARERLRAALPGIGEPR